MNVQYAVNLVEAWKEMQEWPDDTETQTPEQQAFLCLVDEVKALRMIELTHRAETAEQRVKVVEEAIHSARLRLDL